MHSCIVQGSRFSDSILQTFPWCMKAVENELHRSVTYDEDFPIKKNVQ